MALSSPSLAPDPRQTASTGHRSKGPCTLFHLLPQCRSILLKTYSIIILRVRKFCYPSSSLVGFLINPLITPQAWHMVIAVTQSQLFYLDNVTGTLLWMLPESQINSAFITSLHDLSSPDKFLSTELLSFLFSFQPSRHAFLLSFPPAQLLRPPDLVCKRPLFYLLSTLTSYWLPSLPRAAKATHTVNGCGKTLACSLEPRVHGYIHMGSRHPSSMDTTFSKTCTNH